jgi:hypothetical protein
MISALIVVCCFSLLAYWYYQSRLLPMNEINKRIDNVYIVGMVDEAMINQAAKELASVEALCLFVDNSLVASTVSKQYQLLWKSKNPLFHSKEVAEKRKMKVIGYIFQDAEWVNETEGEYLKRVKSAIEEDRKSHHYFLQLTAPGWYAVYGNKQKGISLEK